MGEVPAIATPLTRDGTAAAFLPAYVDVFGEEPDRNRAELLLALAWLENANGNAFIQFNWGNLSTSPNAGVDYWRPPWFDLDKVNALSDGPKKDLMLQRHAQMIAGTTPEAFRAFTSHEIGARTWLNLLKKPGMAPILAAASSGDATAFAHAIFSTRYCPDAACRDAGPSYGALRDEINKAGYFAQLKKKALRAQPRLPGQLQNQPPRAQAQLPGLWFWSWGRLLALRTSGRVGAAVDVLSGEP